MVEAAQAIMKTMGLLVLLESCIVMAIFFVWVVKVEFSWFFGLDIFKWLKEFTRKFNQIDRLFEAKEDHEKDISKLKDNFSKMYSKYGIEKYDAFDDVGGKLSFALAMLDMDNSGIILNAVHSRDNCFLYMKEIVKGESYVMLSQEEVEALRKAVNQDLEK